MIDISNSPEISLGCLERFQDLGGGVPMSGSMPAIGVADAINNGRSGNGGSGGDAASAAVSAAHISVQSIIAFAGTVGASGACW
ncbi:MAG TPA: hypothetical protein VNH53_00965 [Sphingomicrobium sp.]|nr:hypothetical protein [Sphingomicrobium sp.]